MGIKLREAVDFVATSDGASFRLDSLVEISGVHVAASFERLRPALDGRHSLDEICAGVEDYSRPAVRRLLKALESAGMLHEVTDNDRRALTRLGEPWKPYARRAESRGDRFAPALEGFANAQLAIHGTPCLRSALLQAAQSCGLRQCLEHDSAPAVLGIGERSGGPSWAELSVIAVETDRVCGWPRPIDELGRTSTLISGLLLLDDVLIVWPFDGGPDQDCPACITDAYHRSSARLDESFEGKKCLDRAIRIGARLLIQNAIDRWCGTDVPERFLELDVSTLDITARPKRTTVVCPHSMSTWRPRRRRMRTSLARPPLLEELVATMSTRLVDAKTGMVSELSEGALAQIPCHQSSAKVRLPGARDLSVVTDASVDVVTARFEVLKRALEIYLAEAFRAIHPETSVEAEVYASGEHRVWRRCDLPLGVVVVAPEDQEVVVESFFRALALRASESLEWEAVSVDKALFSSEDWPVLDYLQEKSSVEDVRIDRNPALSAGRCEVLRFSSAHRVASIVAGVGGPKLLGIGLRDLWLEATWRRESRQSTNRTAPRLRCSGDSAAELLALMHAMQGTVRQELCLIGLPWLGLDRDEPLSCCYGFLVDAEQCRPSGEMM